MELRLSIHALTLEASTEESFQEKMFWKNSQWTHQPWCSLFWVHWAESLPANHTQISTAMILMIARRKQEIKVRIPAFPSPFGGEACVFARELRFCCVTVPFHYGRITIALLNEQKSINFEEMFNKQSLLSMSPSDFLGCRFLLEEVWLKWHRVLLQLSFPKSLAWSVAHNRSCLFCLWVLWLALE